MEILTTIKRLSENYKVPIEIFAVPSGDMGLYVNYELIGHISINEITSDDYICDCIAKSVEKVLRGDLK